MYLALEKEAERVCEERWAASERDAGKKRKRKVEKEHGRELSLSSHSSSLEREISLEISNKLLDDNFPCREAFGGDVG